MLGGVDVKIGGQALDPAVADQLLEARVDLHLRLPDGCSLRFADPHLDLVDTASFALGADLDVSFVAPTGSSPVSVFTGQVASLEPEFDTSEAVFAIRGYDRSHQLNRTRNTAAYQQMAYSDIAHKLAGANGLSGGTIGSSGGPVPFVQQSNETDWEFLWRLADEIGFDVHVSGQKLNFLPSGGPSGGSPVRLVWGEGLLSFRPRATAVQQVKEVTVRGFDPATKQPIEATAQASQAGAAIGLKRPQASTALGGGTVTIADRPVATSAQATALAKSIAAQLGEAFVEAEGNALGDPALTAGAKVEVEGVGTRFAGTYTISGAQHVLRAGHGYETRFAVSGRASRSMLALVSARTEPSWRHSVVVGVVTNNNDPDGIGRVRVSYPVLGDEHEGWWARLTGPAAGTSRGLMMVPQPGDEVLVAFEHGDEERPYVVGSVWNGTAKPGEKLVHPDGSFSMRSDKQVLVEAAEAMTLTGDKDFTVSVAGSAKITTSERSGDGPPGDVTIDAKGNANVKAGTAISVEAGTAATVEASTDATLKGGTAVKVTAGTQLTLEGGAQVVIKGASVQIQASAMVQISGAQIMLG
jgi:phage protein D